MKKSDLRSGMVVETREGKLYLVVGDFITRESGFNLLSSYDENMLSITGVYIVDIMKVYEFKNEIYNNNASSIKTLLDKEHLTLLWERKEQKMQLTQEQIKILKALNTSGYSWLAIDKDGELFAFKTKPEKIKNCWFGDLYPVPLFVGYLFTFIKWEDEEPTNIDNLLEQAEK